MDPLLAAILAIAGPAIRTLFPYFKKKRQAKKEGRDLSFNMEYIYSSIFGSGGAMLVARIIATASTPLWIAEEIIAVLGSGLFVTEVLDRVIEE